MGLYSFDFHQDIDKEILKGFYGDNLAQALRMFGIFLRNTPEDKRLLNRAYEQENLPEVRRLIHKMKPTFSMVGLPDLEKMAIKTLQIIDECQNKEEVKDVFLPFSNDLDRYLPIIELEMLRMKEALS